MKKNYVFLLPALLLTHSNTFAYVPNMGGEGGGGGACAKPKSVGVNILYPGSQI